MNTTRFTFKDFTKVFGLSIGLTALFLGLFSAFPGAGTFMNGIHPSLSFILAYVVQFAILFFPLWLFVVDKYNANLSDFGFTKIGTGKLLKNVFLVYGAYLLFALAFGILIQFLGLEIPGYGQQDSYVPLFGDDSLGLMVGIFFVVFVAPFVEELYFRGFVYRVFTKEWPVWIGSIMTAAVFAFVHFQFSSFVPLFIVGLFLNWVYQRTQSVWASIGVHMINNAVAFGVSLYVASHPELLEELDLITGLIYNTLTL
ncbi:MAG: membrane protease YdiL (CAAX protease family) [Oceanicoccus sp.]